MTDGTKDTFGSPRSPLDSAEGGRIKVRGNVLSVLCVHDNLLFLDRVCRNLELQGDLSVEISLSVESALHLMKYVLFEVIVTDYTLEEMGKNVFLKAVRGRGNPVPFIYFTRTRNADAEDEACLYGEVYFIEWGGKSTTRGFKELYLSIKEAVYNKKDRNDLWRGVCF
jgi:DNA-binding NtrC family response regulator